MTDEPTGYKPRANFVCLSKKCRTEAGEQRVFEAEVGSTHCTFGHKYIRRLFDAVNVIGTRNVQPEIDPKLTSSSRAVVKDTMMRPGFDMHEKGKSAPGRQLSSFAVPNSSFGAYSGHAGKGRPMNDLERAAVKRHDTAPIHVSNILGPISKQPIPTMVQGRA